MRNKKLYSALAVALALVFTVSMATQAASDIEMDSDGSIEFEENTDPTPPVNPGPGDGGEPDPPKPGTNGPLSIDYVSDFDFGTKMKSTLEEVYNLKYAQEWKNEDTTTEEVPCYVQYTDGREVIGDYDLKVKQNTKFTHTETTSSEPAYGATLDGTEISFLNISIENSFGPSDLTPPSSFVVKADGSQTDVIRADAGKGGGTTLLIFGDQTADNMRESVQLKVPGQQTYIGKYTTSLTWSLEDTP